MVKRWNPTGRGGHYSYLWSCPQCGEVNHVAKNWHGPVGYTPPGTLDCKSCGYRTKEWEARSLPEKATGLEGSTMVSRFDW
jgi:hypothetical protein